MKKVFAVAIMAVMILAGISEAVVRDGAIRGKSGLSFGSIAYTFRGLSVTVRNSTKYNVNFDSESFKVQCELRRDDDISRQELQGHS